MNNEEWRDIAGFESFYKVSNTGLVASLDQDGMNGSRKRKGRVLKCAITRGGQRYVDLMVFGEKSRFLVSSLVASAFIGPRPSGMEVVHLSGDRLDQRASNLRYVTPKEKMVIVAANICEFVSVDKNSLTVEILRHHLDYKDGKFYRKTRTAVSVNIGDEAGYYAGEDRKQVSILGETYELNRLVFFYHNGCFPDYVIPVNGNSDDSRVENLTPMTATEYAIYTDRKANISKGVK